MSAPRGFNGPSSADDGDSGRLTKVVLARRSDVLFRGALDPLALLEALQDRDPRAYQVCLPGYQQSDYLWAGC